MINSIYYNSQKGVKEKLNIYLTFADSVTDLPDLSAQVTSTLSPDLIPLAFT
jgi:hypothetical protein